MGIGAALIGTRQWKEEQSRLFVSEHKHGARSIDILAKFNESGGEVASDGKLDSHNFLAF